MELDCVTNKSKLATTRTASDAMCTADTAISQVWSSAKEDTDCATSATVAANYPDAATGSAVPTKSFTFSSTTNRSKNTFTTNEAAQWKLV